MIRTDKCSACDDRRPCAILEPDTGIREVRLCADCASLAYSQFLCSDAESQESCGTCGGSGMVDAVQYEPAGSGCREVSRNPVECQVCLDKAGPMSRSQ